MYSSIWDTNTYFFKYNIGLLCVLLKEKTENLTIKFKEIFPWTETMLMAHRIKSDKKPFSVKSMYFLRKMVHVVIERYFPLYLKGFEDFS